MCKLINKLIFICFCVLASVPLALLFLISLIILVLVELTGVLMRGNPQEKRNGRSAIKQLTKSFSKSWIDE